MKKKEIFYLQVVIFCIFYPVSVFSAELIAPVITGLVSKDGKGPYQIIMREAASRAGISFKEKFYPPKRALKNFCDNKNSCIYSYTEPASEILGKNKVITSVPLSVFKLYIFTRKGEPALTSAEQLKNIRTAGVMGYEEWYEKAVPGINIDMASSDDIVVKILSRGRVNAILCFLPDMNYYKDKLSFSPEHPLLISYDTITCHNNEAGRKFIKAVSPKLKEMNEDGTMKKILGDYYLEWKYSEFFEWSNRK